MANRIIHRAQEPDGTLRLKEARRHIAQIVNVAARIAANVIADFRSVLDGELAETYIESSLRAEKDMVFQNTLFKPTLLGALPAISKVLQAPNGESCGDLAPESRVWQLDFRQQAKVN